jgi:N-acetylneuraminic acid mutarotase
MLVWGGQRVQDAQFLSNGLGYGLRTRTWVAIPPAPIPARSDQSAIWTGSKMIVWGGSNVALFDEVYGDGAAYDPSTKRWAKIAQAPLSPRVYNSAVWTGREMIVWGGGVIAEQGEEGSTQLIPAGTLFHDGAAYDPAADTWTLLPKAPIKGRSGQVAIWTGREMILWGGAGIGESNLAFKDGAAFDPATRRWRLIPEAPLPPGTAYTAVWTGKQMLVYGGPRGRAAAYDPVTDAWSKLPRPPFDALVLPVSAWTGRVMLVWGGEGVTSAELDKARGIGAVYDPASNRWTALPKAPGATGLGQTAVWTGHDMLVWGGLLGRGPFRTGVDYRPSATVLP